MEQSKKWTTFVSPPINAQLRLWDDVYLPQAIKSDETIIMGNYTTMNPTLESGRVLKKPLSERRMDNLMILRKVFLANASNPHITVLIGGNEIAMLNQPEKWLDAETLKFLAPSWIDRSFDPKIMVATVTATGELVTHGGLTRGLWLELGKPSDPYETAELLNRRYWGQLFLGSSYATGGNMNHYANPVFAHPFYELYPSWLNSEIPDMPFSQIVGSDSFRSGLGRQMLADKNSPLYFAEKVQTYNWGTKITIGDHSISSVGLRLRYEPVTKLDTDEGLYVATTKISENQQILADTDLGGTDFRYKK